MSNPSSLDEIQARAEEAFEGPWQVRHDHFDAGPGPDDEAQDWYLVEGADAVEHWAHYDKATTEFIAHAREDVPKLVAALRAVEEVHEPVDALMYGGRSQAHKVQVCTGCGQDDGNWNKWPCPTIRAIEGALS